jgi:hypothetical protein
MRCTRVCGQEKSRSPYLRPRSYKAGAAQLPAQAWRVAFQRRLTRSRCHVPDLEGLVLGSRHDGLGVGCKFARKDATTVSLHRAGRAEAVASMHADERYQQRTLRDVKCRADPDPLRRRARVATVAACCHRQGEHPGLQSAEPGFRRSLASKVSASFAKTAWAVKRNTV